VHLLNYDPSPAAGVRVRLQFGKEAGERPRLVTPDAGTKGLRDFHRTGPSAEFTLDALETYGVVVLD
jgi:hypothetical protein